MLISAARELRQRMTQEEVILWQHLRLLRGQGLHFRRQMPIGRYIVDFACKRRRIVVEVDGGQHNFDHHAAQDARRDQDLRARGYRVLRVWNSDVSEDIGGVVETILHYVGRSSGGKT